MASETTPDAPREAVRPAVECSSYDGNLAGYVHDGVPLNQLWGSTGYSALAVDNETHGGLVARVRAAVDRILPDNDWTVSQREDAVERGVATILAALGVRP